MKVPALTTAIVFTLTLGCFALLARTTSRPPECAAHDGLPPRVSVLFPSPFADKEMGLGLPTFMPAPGGKISLIPLPPKIDRAAELQVVAHARESVSVEIVHPDCANDVRVAIHRPGVGTPLHATSLNVHDPARAKTTFTTLGETVLLVSVRLPPEAPNNFSCNVVITVPE